MMPGPSQALQPLFRRLEYVRSGWSRARGRALSID